MSSWIVWLLAIILFPIGLVMFAFSSCDVRKRSEKHACKTGDLEQCLSVAKYYDDKQAGKGIISFLMSHSDTAIAYYFRACKLESSTGCDRMLDLFHHGEQAKNLSTDTADIADALIDACVERVVHGCDDLEAFMKEGDWVENRSAIAFKKRCDGGTAQACFRLAAMHGANLGGLHNNREEVVPLYDKACAAHIENSCELAQAYRDEQTKRAHDSPDGSGATP
ncbi:MAG: hypothetical protein ABI591_18880 [Kofleriaceae bacterium]